MQAKRGFTLIELLAATALAALLMVAVMQIIASLGQAEQIIATLEPTPQWQTALRHQIERDVTHARAATFDDTTSNLTLETWSHITSPGSSTPGTTPGTTPASPASQNSPSGPTGPAWSHAPSSVSYVLKELDAEDGTTSQALLRVQSDPLNPDAKTQIDLLCVGVAAVEWITPEPDTFEEEREVEELATSQTIELSVRFNDPQTPEFRVTLTLPSFSEDEQAS